MTPACRLEEPQWGLTEQSLGLSQQQRAITAAPEGVPGIADLETGVLHGSTAVFDDDSLSSKALEVRQGL